MNHGGCGVGCDLGGVGAAAGADRGAVRSVGAGAHGPRDYDWARIPLDTDWPPGRGRWLLARRSIRHPSAIAYYVCYGPRRTRLLDLAWVAGSRWHVEECFQQATNEAGLDHYQARSWRARCAHTTLSPLALAWLSVAKHRATKRGCNTHQEGMIAYTLAELRRLLTNLTTRTPHPAEHVWAWSHWRRRRTPLSPPQPLPTTRLSPVDAVAVLSVDG